MNPGIAQTEPNHAREPFQYLSSASCTDEDAAGSRSDGKAHMEVL